MRPVRALARLYPWDVTASDELRRAVAFLGWSVSPADIVRAGYGAGTLGGVGALIAVVVAPPGWRLAAATGSVALALAVTHAVHAGPRLLATARRTTALGTAPELVVLAVLRMRLAPAPERAAAFAVETGDGRLAGSLAAHVRRARGTARTGFERFGAEWAEWFPALDRALALISAAGESPDHDRARTLDRAMDVVLEGTHEEMQRFAADVRGPVTALYAFGVLLPTALVALLPAARAAGLAVTPPVVAAVYDVGLPLVLVGGSASLLARRPVAFPPARLGPDHPDVDDRRGLAVLAGLTAAVATAAGTGAVFPDWAPPIASLGAGTGTALVIRYRPFVAVQRDVRDVERGLTDALSLVGRRVSNGRSVERAIQAAATDLSGAIGDLLSDGARRQRQLDVGVERAFLGEFGALRSVPSPRVRGSVALLAVAARQGTPAGRAVLAVADHVDDLRAVERDARADLRTILETLRSTGAVFGPLVGGATVALAGHMAGGGVGLPGSTEPMPWLGLLVGWYVLVLATVLTALSVALERSLDRHLVAYRVGVALLSATAAYLAGYWLSAAVA